MARDHKSNNPCKHSGGALRSPLEHASCANQVGPILITCLAYQTAMPATRELDLYQFESSSSLFQFLSKSEPWRVLVPTCKYPSVRRSDQAQGWSNHPSSLHLLKKTVLYWHQGAIANMTAQVADQIARRSEVPPRALVGAPTLRTIPLQNHFQNANFKSIFCMITKQLSLKLALFHTIFKSFLLSTFSPPLDSNTCTKLDHSNGTR